MEDEAGEIRGIRGRRKEARYAQVFAMEGFWNWRTQTFRFFETRKLTKRIVILENYNGAACGCFPVHSFRRYFQVLGTVTKINSAPKFFCLSFLRQFIFIITNGKFGPLLFKNF